MSVEILGQTWIDGDNDPPALELRLSDGSFVRVGYDDTYHHRILWWSPDLETDFVSCTAERTGLHSDVLGWMESKAEQAVRSWAVDERSMYWESHCPDDGNGGL